VRLNRLFVFLICILAVIFMTSCGPNERISYTTTSNEVTPGKISLEKLVTTADVILIGTVNEVISYQEDSNIYTRVTLSVEQTIKGEIGNEVAIKVPGGEYNGISLNVTDNPSFNVDEKVLVFLTKSDNIYEVYGGFQGKILINENNMITDNTSLEDYITLINNILTQ
jgi:uncharacterized protein YkvS